MSNNYQWAKPKLYNFPVMITRNEYKNVRKKHSQAIKDVEGVKEVFNCGNIDMPGISDLDFLVITDEDKVDFNTLRKLFKDLKGNEKYTAGHHHPFYVPKYIGLDFKYILPLSNISKFGGKQIFDLSKTLNSNEKLIILGELFLEFYPYKFFHKLYSGDFPVRETFMDLKSFRFPLIFFKDLDLDIDYSLINNYLIHFSELKEVFLNLDANEKGAQIFTLTKNALDICYFMIDKLDKYIKSQNLNFNEKRSHVDSYSRSIFSDRLFKKSLNRTYFYQKNFNKKIVIFPNSFSIFSTTYDNYLDLVYKEEIVKRKKIIQSYKKYIIKHNINDLLIYPPYLLSPNSKKYNLILKLLSYF